MDPFAAQRAEALTFAHEGKATYWREGREEWDEEAYVKKRRALRRSMKVQVAVVRFWQLFDREPEESIVFEEYAAVHRKITAVLAPDMKDRDAAAAASEDWQDDAGGNDEISLAQYTVGLFSIADMWCVAPLSSHASHAPLSSRSLVSSHTSHSHRSPSVSISLSLFPTAVSRTDSVEEKDYVDFLTRLFLRISVRSHTPHTHVAARTHKECQHPHCITHHTQSACTLHPAVHCT